MKIVHIITRLLRGGAEENTLSSCFDQVRRGYDVTLVHGRDSAPEPVRDAAQRMNVIALDSLVRSISPTSDVRACRALVSLLRDIRPDVVHTHESKAGIVGRLAAHLARVPAIVHTVHIAPFVNVSRAEEVLYVTAERLAARWTDAFIDVSDGMRRAYVERKIGDPDAHVVVRSAMNVATFRDAQVPTDWRARIGGWPSEARPRIVLYAGAFEPRKRQREFMRAIEPRLRGRDDICVLFAGEGPLLDACRDEASQRGLSQMRFLGHDDRFHELVALADVCVLTSEREGLPRVVVQFIAAGKPVVVTHLPGIEEIVTHGRSGLVLGTTEIAAAAAGAVELCDDDNARARLAAGAAATDTSAWAADRANQTIADVYTAVLAKR